MRLLPHGRRPLLMILGVLLLLYALWGLFTGYPDFATLRSEPANVSIPPPGASAAP
jgi:hypothetical protein